MRFGVILISLLLSGCWGWGNYYGSKEASPTRQVDRPQPSMIAIEAGRKDAYYLVDGERGICFFQNGSALTRVECSTIPEASEFLPAGLAAAKSSQAGTRPAAPQANPNANPGTPVAAKKDGTVGEPATAEEALAFKKAYAQVLCASRQGKPFSPAKVIKTRGFSVKRYAQIESQLAQESKDWAKFIRSAAGSCTVSPKATTSPDADAP